MCVCVSFVQELPSAVVAKGSSKAVMCDEFHGEAPTPLEYI